MHSTLTTRTNVILAGVWGCLAAAAALLTRPRPLAALAVGAGFGVAVGVLQSKSMGQSSVLFKQASTAMDVRRALLSTAPGKWAIRLQWSGVAVLVGTVLWDGSLIAGIVAGYAIFMCVREVVTLKAVIRLGTTTA